MLDDVDINKIIVSHKVFWAEKDLYILLLDHDKFTSLCVMLPKMNGYKNKILIT